MPGLSIETFMLQLYYKAHRSIDSFEYRVIDSLNISAPLSKCLLIEALTQEIYHASLLCHIYYANRSQALSPVS